MTRRLVTATLAVASLAAGTVAAQTPGPRAFVLDGQARTVTALALTGSRQEQTATLTGTPSMSLRTADGQSLLVLDRGEGRDAGDDGYQAKARSTLTILDGRTLAARHRRTRLGPRSRGDARRQGRPRVGAVPGVRRQDAR